MLYMSFVYFSVWQIKLSRPDDFEKAMTGFNKELEKKLLAATSPFTFWRINESSVMRFFKLIGCNNSKIGSYAALVKERHYIQIGFHTTHQPSTGVEIVGIILQHWLHQHIFLDDVIGQPVTQKFGVMFRRIFGPYAIFGCHG